MTENGVRITQAVDSSNKIGPPKTKAGRRFIPIGSIPLGLAHAYAEKHGNCDLVFPSRTGGHQQYRNFLRRGWHRLMEEAGLMIENSDHELKPKYTPYALRHFFASMLIHQNKNLKFIQTVMGHNDIKTTFDVYGHIIKEKESLEMTDYSGIVGDLV